MKNLNFRIRRLLFALSAFLCLEAAAQSATVSGLVTDSEGEPLLGVSVYEKGSASGVTTDLDGNYSIKVKNHNATLVFSYIGCETREIALKGKTKLDVVMQENATNLDEVVVVGYGTMKKRDLSGSMSQIKADDLLKGGAIDVAHGMQGKLAGVQIQQADGTPGGGVSITVRGANSFQTSSQPLFIVDGVPFETGSTPGNDTGGNQSTNPLSFINPHDIESIEVLKDASATAIYGSRGANGVVIITTKRGQVGKAKVTLSANWTMSKIAKRMEVLDPVTYAQYCNEEIENSRFYEGSRTDRLAYDSRWTPDNAEGALWPKATAGYTRDWKLSNRYVEDGSYLKLKNLTLGYNWMSPVKGIESIKISFTATNLFTISNYSWLDPDVNSFGDDASRRGVDIYSYPSARTFSLGLNVAF